MILISRALWFPDPREADEDGLLAIGGDMSTDRLLLAYRSGIFPWFMEAGEVYWFSPPARMVLFADEIHVGRTMKNVLQSNEFRVTEDHAFEELIRSCAEVHHKEDGDTWINEAFIEAYTRLYHLGHAHSIEVWHEEKLVGGMYGVPVGKMFCGESMFSRISNASKVALIHLCQSKKYSIVDCQVATNHLTTMGGRKMSRDEFLEILKRMQ